MLLQRKTALIIFINTALVLCIIFFMIFFRVKIITSLIYLGLIPQPEKYTELYFEDNEKLPALLSTSPQSFRFTIHNLEYKIMQYPYSVYIQSGNNTQQIDTQTVILGKNQYKTITENYTPATTSAQQSKVIVLLKNKHEQIDFLLSNSYIQQ